MQRYVKDAFCSYCGYGFEVGQAWPRSCGNCQKISYVNPLPSAVLVQPVDEGVLLIQRAIEPGFGKWALPGGFIDMGESWEEAAARELWEEAEIRTDPKGITLLQVHSVESKRILLVFGLATPMTRQELPPFRKNEEISDRAVVSFEELGSYEMAFPLHLRVTQQYFDGQNRSSYL